MKKGEEVAFLSPWCIAPKPELPYSLTLCCIGRYMLKLSVNI